MSRDTECMDLLMDRVSIVMKLFLNDSIKLTLLDSNNGRNSVVSVLIRVSSITFNRQRNSYKFLGLEI